MVFLTAFFAAALGLSIPIAAGILVDQVIPEADRSGLWVMCVFLVVLAFSATVGRVLQGLLVLRIEGRVSATMIPAVWDRLLRLPPGFFARFSSGDLAFRAMEFSKVFKKISGATVTTLVMGLFAIFNLGLLFFYSWKMALCTTLLLGVLVTVTGVFLAGLLRFETSIHRIDGVISGLLLELLGGIITLRTAGAERRAFSRWAGRYTERLVLSIQGRRFANRLHQWLAVYPILTAMVVYAGALYVDTGLLKTGSFLAFSIAFANLMAAVLAVGYGSMGLVDLLPTFERIRPILEERPEFAAAVIEPVRLSGAISLNHISFRYPGQDQGTKVLDDVSLQVRPGEFVAIVGPSGAGKSTLMRLLLGFETPDAGSVTYDGRELATLDLREVRRQIGVVLQQAQLLPTDILGNIIGFAPLLDDRRRVGGGADGGPRGRHPADADGNAHAGRGRRGKPLERPAAAVADRAGDRAAAQDPAARRGDERARQRDAGNCGRQPDQPASRDHPGGDCPPPGRGGQGRSHLCSEGQPDRPIGAVPSTARGARSVPGAGAAADAAEQQSFSDAAWRTTLITEGPTELADVVRRRRRPECGIHGHRSDCGTVIWTV